MTARALMLQGTGTDVGKSIITAGLCRAARRRGLSVAPFKPQNMSNNAAVCENGGEIGRAQALQAMAAGLAPHTDFNPVLLKPQTDRDTQVIVHGRPKGVMSASNYMTNRIDLMGAVMESFDRLSQAHDLILIEGAGSPAETNLRDRDIANMGFARKAGVPVCLLGDIDKGGVIASIVGTKAVLSDADAAMIVGFAINKFRGDPALFEDGVIDIERRAGLTCFGVIPWLEAVSLLPAEDAVSMQTKPRNKAASIKIAAPMLSRISNFDDADPLRQEPNVDFCWVAPGRPIPKDADVIILFGTKSTIGDLQFLRSQGWDHDIHSHVRHGGRVLGICGGYQMLGQRIVDREGVDGQSGETQGLGLLDLTTEMSNDKTVLERNAVCTISGERVTGYEIHAGRSKGNDLTRAMLRLDDREEGARSVSGAVEGTYVHGLFANDRFRSTWLARVGAEGSDLNYHMAVNTALDQLADGLEQSLEIDRLFACAQLPGWHPASFSVLSGTLTP